MKYALVIDGIIDSISIANPPSDEWVEVPDTAFAGDTYNQDGTVTPKEPDPPTLDELYPPLAPYQFDAILEIAGLKPTLDAAIASMDANVRAVAKAKMNKMTTYYRSDQLLNNLAINVLGLTDEQINELWYQAGQL